MVDNPTPGPEDVIARDDPGDDTANRYRFQWTWAAIACCILLDDTEDCLPSAKVGQIPAIK